MKKIISLILASLVCTFALGQSSSSDFSEMSFGKDEKVVATSAVGPQTVFVALLNFPDRSLLTTRDEIVTAVNDMCSYYDVSSYHQNPLTPTVTVQVYMMPHPSTYYGNSSNRARISIDARAVVSNDYGDVYNNYNHLMYCFPMIDKWGNTAYTSGKESWMNGRFNNGLFTHEMGHSFGLAHAHRWKPCDLSNPVDTCGTIAEYGDIWDVMGGQSILNDLNMYEKRLLGWLPIDKINQVTVSGVYRIYRFDDASALNNPILALSFPEPVTGKTFYVGYRYSRTQTRNGAYIIWGDNWSSRLINHNPQKQGADSIWPIGSTLVDGGLRITPLRLGGVAPNTWMDVQVMLP